MYLIDTNVMMAASALSEVSAVAVRAMPREIEMREIVYEWLEAFDLSDEVIVLDDLGLIRDEYERNLPFNYREQEYGLRVLQAKIDRCLVEYVPIEALEANGEHIALVDAELEQIVTDREDRKWVASALSAHDCFGISPPIVFGAESDWIKARARLNARGVQVLPLLPEHWYAEPSSHR